jgi:hypothetical protein
MRGISIPSRGASVRWRHFAVAGLLFASRPSAGGPLVPTEDDWAHHEASVRTEVGRTIVGLSDGTYVAAFPRGQWSINKGAPALWIELPVYQLWSTYGNANGIGDLRVGALWAWDLAPVRIIAAAEVSAPTANAHSGLGRGTLELLPRLGATYSFERVTVSADAEYLFAQPIGEHGAHQHLVLVRMRDLQELRARVAGSVQIFGPLLAEAALERTWTLQEYAWPVFSRSAARAALDARFGSLRFTLDAALPLSRSRAFEWVLGGRLSYRF